MYDLLSPPHWSYWSAVITNVHVIINTTLTRTTRVHETWIRCLTFDPLLRCRSLPSHSHFSPSPSTDLPKISLRRNTPVSPSHRILFFCSRSPSLPSVRWARKSSPRQLLAYWQPAQGRIRSSHARTRRTSSIAPFLCKRESNKSTSTIEDGGEEERFKPHGAFFSHAIRTSGRWASPCFVTPLYTHFWPPSSSGKRPGPCQTPCRRLHSYLILPEPHPSWLGLARLQITRAGKFVRDLDRLQWITCSCVSARAGQPYFHFTCSPHHDMRLIDHPSLHHVLYFASHAPCVYRVPLHSERDLDVHHNACACMLCIWIGTAGVQTIFQSKKTNKQRHCLNAMSLSFVGVFDLSFDSNGLSLTAQG